MNNLKISTRLITLIGFLSTLLICIGVLGLFGISQSNAALKTVYEDRTIPLGDVAEANYLVIRNRILIMDMFINPEISNIQKRNKEINENIDRVSKLWATYMATYLTPEETNLAASYAKARTSYVQEGVLPTANAMLAGNTEAALIIYNEKISILAPVVQGFGAKLIGLQIEVAKQEYENAVSNYSTIRTVSVVVILAGVLFALSLGLGITHGIGRQLGGEPSQAVDLARNVAQGNLSIPVVLKAGDTTSMMAQLKAMQESLTGVVHRVRQGSDSVATASIQIAQGNHDLAGRTSSQASALEQTAAAMEELNATVKQNTDSARQANQLALNASAVAIQGGAVVAKVVDTMKGINDSSKRIFDIISVIDGIAFQTNILALNAAVEAARAGEQGRGFAVVASEVRLLAGRSAEAAKEIKGLISASVERVEQGTVLVDQAGATMTEVVSSIRRATDLMGEISAASNEQSLGVSQVGEAITHMDQATQQNAALVEEMAAAASSLESQAKELVQVVAVFNLGGRYSAPLLPM